MYLFRELVRPLEPERHVHLAVHDRCSLGVPERLVPLARPLKKLTEPEIAMGGQGTHAKLRHQLKRFHITTLCLERASARDDFRDGA